LEKRNSILYDLPLGKKEDQEKGWKETVWGILLLRLLQRPSTSSVQSTQHTKMPFFRESFSEPKKELIPNPTYTNIRLLNFLIECTKDGLLSKSLRKLHLEILAYLCPSTLTLYIIILTKS
jgi:hypothetical protein